MEIKTEKIAEERPLAKLAGTLNLTEPDVAWVLSKEEEKQIIAYAIDQKKKHYEWRLRDKDFTPAEIRSKMKEIDWPGQVDEKKLLRDANAAKEQNMWHMEQRASEKKADQERKAELIQRCTAAYMFKLMSWTSQNEYGTKLIVNDDNRHFITTLCYFLSNDPKFESELGYDPNKGLLIRGISGIGKTHLVRCLANNELNPIHILNLLEITDEIKDKGEYEIRIGDRKILYLDDVGTEEPTVKHYGTNISYFKNFIELVYLKNNSFSKLMISTNNSFAQMEEKYGFRVRSKCKDMFNVIDVKGDDMRGKL